MAIDFVVLPLLLMRFFFISLLIFAVFSFITLLVIEYIKMVQTRRSTYYVYSYVGEVFVGENAVLPLPAWPDICR